MAWWSGVDVGDWAILVAAISMLALAALLLVVDIGNRVHRALALFLFLRALLDGSLIFEPTVDDLAGRLRGYLFIAVPFAVVYFSFIYRRRYQGKRFRWAHDHTIPSALLVGAVACEALYLWDHDLLASPSARGPLSLFLILPQALYAAIAVLFAYDFRRKRASEHRVALLLAAVGLSLEPLFYSSFRAMDFVFDLVRDVRPGADFYLITELVGAAIAFVLVATVAVLVWVRARELGQKAWLVRLGTVWGLVLLSAGVAAVIFFQAGDEPDRTTGSVLTTFRAVWLLGFPVLVTYALVKYHLFDADVKLRFAIRGTTLAAIFVGVAFILSEAAQEFFGRQTSNAYIAIFGASLLVFALAPLQHFADRLAKAAVPAATPLSELSHPERVRIYREQLELAWSDGHLTRKERLLFDRLRERLGMSPKEAAMLESEVVAQPIGPRRRSAAKHAQ